MMKYRNWIIVLAIIMFALLWPQLANFWSHYEYGMRVRQAEDMARAIERTYENDRVGGKMPEETFDLFILALKENNTLQASRYYEPFEQLKALSALQAELAKNGNLHKSIERFNLLKDSAGLSFNMNMFTRIWKIRTLP